MDTSATSCASNKAQSGAYLVPTSCQKNGWERINIPRLNMFASTCLVELIRNRRNRRFASCRGIALCVVELTVLDIIFVVQQHVLNLAHRPQVLGSKNILVSFTFGLIYPVVYDNQRVCIPFFSFCSNTKITCTNGLIAGEFSHVIYNLPTT